MLQELMQVGAHDFVTAICAIILWNEIWRFVFRVFLPALLKRPPERKDDP